MGMEVEHVSHNLNLQIQLPLTFQYLFRQSFFPHILLLLYCNILFPWRCISHTVRSTISKSTTT